MKSRRASVRIESGLDCVDSAVRMLEDEWQRHGDVHLESFWAEQNRRAAVGGVDSLGVLAELVKTDLRRRFDAGQRPTVAEYLERFPELAGADSRVLSLVYEEFCLCEERDGCADVDSFCDRYTGLEELARIAASLSPDDQSGRGSDGSVAAVPEGGRAIRGV